MTPSRALGVGWTRRQGYGRGTRNDAPATNRSHREVCYVSNIHFMVYVNFMVYGNTPAPRDGPSFYIDQRSAHKVTHFAGFLPLYTTRSPGGASRRSLACSSSRRCCCHNTVTVPRSRRSPHNIYMTPHARPMWLCGVFSFGHAERKSGFCLENRLIHAYVSVSCYPVSKENDGFAIVLHSA